MKSSYKWARIVDENAYDYKIDPSSIAGAINKDRNIVNGAAIVSELSRYKIGQPVEAEIIEQFKLANIVDEHQIYKDNEGFVIRGWGESFDGVVIKKGDGFVRGTRADEIYKRWKTYRKLIL